MNRIPAMICACLASFSLLGCQQEQAPAEPAVVRSFLAGYEEEHRSNRLLLNLMEDGTAEYYVGTLENGTHTTARSSTTYTLGENADFDETIRFTNHDGTTTDAVIVDAVFEIDGIRFYETAPAAMDGDVYVGYLSKTSGMGPMTYAYALCLRDDATFDVSITQMASVMHVWGATGGTYQANSDGITFTYDILTDEGELVAASAIAEGIGFNGTTLTAAFNIQQNTMRASNARFINVN